MTSPTLEARSVCKSYDDGRIEAVRGVDLSIAAGDIWPSLDRAEAANQHCCTCWGDWTSRQAAKFFSGMVNSANQLIWIHFPGVPPDAHAARNRECTTADDWDKWQAP
jgi:hypothetical protein